MEIKLTKQKKTTSNQVGTGKKTRKQQTKAAATPMTKLARLESMLRRTEGAAIAQLAKTLDWQSHSVRGAISSLKKKQGFTIVTDKASDGERVYRIAS